LFLNDFNIDNEQQQLQVSSSTSSTSNQSLSQSSSSINSWQITDATPNETIRDQASNNSLTNPTSSQPKIFPLNYILPTFDKAFEGAANDLSLSDFGARCSQKQQLIKTIPDDVVNNYGIDFYLTSFGFDRMIVSVKNKCPPLCKIFGEDMVCLIEDRVLFYLYLIFVYHLEFTDIRIKTTILSWSTSIHLCIWSIDEEKTIIWSSNGRKKIKICEGWFGSSSSKNETNFFL
jgi:hypothetical protein